LVWLIALAEAGLERIVSVSMSTPNSGRPASMRSVSQASAVMSWAPAAGSRAAMSVTRSAAQHVEAPAAKGVAAGDEHRRI
jgi:hypothetical protein